MYNQTTKKSSTSAFDQGNSRFPCASPSIPAMSRRWKASVTPNLPINELLHFCSFHLVSANKVGTSVPTPQSHAVEMC